LWEVLISGACLVHLVRIGFAIGTAGHQFSFIVAASGFIVGIVIMACAWSYAALMFGCVFVGLGVGFGLAVHMYYNMSEVMSLSMMLQR
jgi:hypothetical protein